MSKAVALMGFALRRAASLQLHPGRAATLATPASVPPVVMQEECMQ